MFLYTYRGFTPAEVVNQPNIVPVHQHWLVWHLLKINGGFEILRRGDGYVLNYDRRDAGSIMRDPPVLMLPSREQDYSDPYFRMIFPKAVRLLRETTVLVLVGYSLPKEDALIRFILRQFAEEPEDGRRKIIFYIGPGTAGIAGIAPKDSLEDMIAAQMLACHNASMYCYAIALNSNTTGLRSEHLNQAGKLSRTFAMLLDALNRHRGKGAQKITVEHVIAH